MKITIFIGSLYGGGAERCACNLANHLVRNGHQVEVLTVSETRYTYDLDEKVKIKSLLRMAERKGSIYNAIIRFVRLWEYLIKTKCDVYIVMLPLTIIMFMLLRWLTNAKVVISERNDPAKYPRIVSCLLKRFAGHVDGFVFQTNDAKLWYERSMKKTKFKVIPNAVNTDFIRPPYVGKKRKIIMGIGRLCEQKNFNLLIRAFGKVASEFSDYNLVIYGEGRKRKSLERLIEYLELRDRVFLPGNIQNIVEEMEQNCLFVLSSDYEGIPNALIESMSLGIPCISTDCPCGGPRSLIHNGVNGILVPVGDSFCMAKMMKDLLRDDDKRNRMGKKAMNIREQLSPEKIYQAWEDFILNV